jgi:hypothetical protein
MDVDAFLFSVIPEYSVRVRTPGLGVRFKHLLTVGARPGIVLLTVEAVVTRVACQISQGL